MEDIIHLIRKYYIQIKNQKLSSFFILEKVDNIIDETEWPYLTEHAFT